MYESDKQVMHDQHARGRLKRGVWVVIAGKNLLILSTILAKIALGPLLNPMYRTSHLYDFLDPHQRVYASPIP